MHTHAHTHAFMTCMRKHCTSLNPTEGACCLRMHTHRGAFAGMGASGPPGPLRHCPGLPPAPMHTWIRNACAPSPGCKRAHGRHATHTHNVGRHTAGLARADASPKWHKKGLWPGVGVGAHAACAAAPAAKGAGRAKVASSGARQPRKSWSCTPVVHPATGSPHHACVQGPTAL